MIVNNEKSIRVGSTVYCINGSNARVTITPVSGDERIATEAKIQMKSKTKYSGETKYDNAPSNIAMSATIKIHAVPPYCLLALRFSGGMHRISNVNLCNNTLFATVSIAGREEKSSGTAHIAMIEDTIITVISIDSIPFISAEISCVIAQVRPKTVRKVP